jgi:hypothetical protein
MPDPTPDLRGANRRALDDLIAAEPPLPPPDLPPGATPSPVEAHLPTRRPLAIEGVVENGLIRPLDLDVRPPEHSRVIIVAAGGT